MPEQIQKRQGGDETKCPYCSELIKTNALICRFCNREIQSTRNTPNRNVNPIILGGIFGLMVGIASVLAHYGTIELDIQQFSTLLYLAPFVACLGAIIGWLGSVEFEAIQKFKRPVELAAFWIAPIHMLIKCIILMLSANFTFKNHIVMNLAQELFLIALSYFGLFREKKLIVFAAIALWTYFLLGGLIALGQIQEATIFMLTDFLGLIACIGAVTGNLREDKTEMRGK